MSEVIEAPAMGEDLPQGATPETPNPTPATGATPPAPNQDDEAQLPPKVKELLGKFRDMEKDYLSLKSSHDKAQKDAEKAQKDALAEQGKFKELYEAEVAKREAAETTAKQLAHERLVDTIANDAKLPKELRDRLRGETEEELREDAKALAKFAQPRPEAPDLDATKRGGSNAIADENYMAEIARQMGIKMPQQLAPQ